MSKHKKEIDFLRARVAELEAENARLTEEVGRLTKQLESRKLTERAKGILMARHYWTEKTAWENLQRCSMNTRIPLAVVAQRILNGEQIDQIEGDR